MASFPENNARTFQTIIARLVVATIFLTVSLSSSPAATRNWTVFSGTWNLASNWSGGVVPTPLDFVIIDNGGTAFTTGAVVNSLIIGQNFSGTLIANAGLLRTLSDLRVGDLGTGTLNVDSVSTIVQGSAYLGYESTASGLFSLTNGSSLSVGDTLSIGQSGTGTMFVQQSFVNTLFGVIGHEGSGTVTVTADGRWTNNAQLIIGATGTGSLNISDAGGVFAEVTSLAESFEAQAIVVVSGSAGREGFLQTSKIVEGEGNGKLTIDGGRIVATEDQADFLSGFEAGDVILGAGGAHIYSSGKIGIACPLGGAGALHKEGSGALTLTGSNSYAGGTVVVQGKLVAGSAHSLGTGDVTINSGTLSLGTGVNITNKIKLAGGTLEKGLTTGSTLNGAIDVESQVPGGILTTAALVSGTVSGEAFLTVSFSGSATVSNDSIRRSDIFSLSGISMVEEGTGETDLFVLEMTATPADGESFLGWLDDGAWVNAVEGNFGNNALGTQQGFEGDFSAFQITYGTDLSSYVGAWGVSGDTAWAVLNHNSEFAIVPEPSNLILTFLGVAILFSRRK